MENRRRRISVRPPNINRHPARAARTPDHPATGTSVAPGDRPARTPVIQKPHLHTPEMHRATMRPGAGGEVRRQARLRTHPPAPGRMLAMRSWGRSGEWGFGIMGVTRCVRNAGATDVSVSGRAGIRGALRDGC